jgi:hypothetical protein
MHICANTHWKEIALMFLHVWDQCPCASAWFCGGICAPNMAWAVLNIFCIGTGWGAFCWYCIEASLHAEKKRKAKLTTGMCVSAAWGAYLNWERHSDLFWQVNATQQFLRNVPTFTVPNFCRQRTCGCCVILFDPVVSMLHSLRNP